MKVEPRKEHQWLQKLMGEWTFEVEAMMGPEEPPEKFSGSESVRSIGDVWIQCEGHGNMCDSDTGTATTLMTLGYDPQKKQYVGTWVGSMMTHLWIYQGSLDQEEKILTLNTEGPSFSAEGKLGKFRDVIEIKSDDHRVLTSHMLGDDGTWHQFMTANYRRKQQE